MANARQKREKRKERVSAAKRRAQKHGSGGFTAIHVPSGMQILSVKKAGVYKWDIIPYVVTDSILRYPEDMRFADPGEYYFERTYYVYYQIGAGQNAYTSPSRTFGKKDYIAEYRQKLDQDPNADEKAIKALISKERQLFLVWDRTTDSEAAKGVQLLDIANFNFGKLLDSRVNSVDDGDPDFAHVPFFYLPDEEGSTLRVTFDEEKMEGGRAFQKASGIDFVQRKKPLPDEILEQAVDLDALPKLMDYKELKRIFLQIDADDDMDDDDEPVNGAPRGRAAPKRPAKPVHDMDDDDDDDEDEPAPAKTKPKKGRAVKLETAEEAGIEEGDLVEYKGEQMDVTKVSRDGTSLTLADEDGEEYKAVAVADVTKVAEDWGDEDDEPAPKKPAKAKTKPAKAAVEEDDDFDDEDDEPAPKPKAKGKKAAKAPVADEDDDDDFDDDDFDDEPAPKPKRGKKPAKAAVAADDEDDDDF